tara:strand:- start:53 stop:499 length:447 start_codon:yes stop_codon:yes gene_type:complete
MKQLEFNFEGKKRKFKISTKFIEDELNHKSSGVTYDDESKRAYEILDELTHKYFQIDRRKKFNKIEITEEEYQTWYVYFLEYYIDDESIFKNTWEEKEAKRLLKALIKFFGNPTFNMDHRAGAKMRFVRTLIKTGIAQKLLPTHKTKQ